MSTSTPTTNFDNLKRFYPNYFSDTLSTPQKTTSTSHPPSSLHAPAGTNVTASTSAAQSDRLTIDDIITDPPKTSILREYFRDKIDAINELNDQHEKQFLQELDSKC